MYARTWAVDIRRTSLVHGSDEPQIKDRCPTSVSQTHRLAYCVKVGGGGFLSPCVQLAQRSDSPIGRPCLHSLAIMNVPRGITSDTFVIDPGRHTSHWYAHKLKTVGPQICDVAGLGSRSSPVWAWYLWITTQRTRRFSRYRFYSRKQQT